MITYPEDSLPPQLTYTLWSFVQWCKADLKDPQRAFRFGSYNFRYQLERSFFPETLERIYAVMPRAKRKKDNDNGRGQRNSVTWVNIPLESDDELHIATTWEHDDVCLTDMVNLLGQGWAFSIKPDDRTDGYVCFATGDYVVGDGKGLGVAGRASSPLDALRVALFRVAVLCTGQYVPTPRSSENRFR